MNETIQSRLFYVMKISHLTHLEHELRTLRSRLNTLHELEATAPAPDVNELEHIDQAYLNLLTVVQQLRTAVQPMALQE